MDPATTPDAATRIQDELIFGEYGDVNPSICDSSTFTFLDPATMADMFEGKVEGCFLYSRHWNPTNRALAQALADMEGTEDAVVTGSGMAAISVALLQLCGQGDEIVASRMVYGGTYALLQNLLPRFGIRTRWVDTNDLDAVEAALTEHTKVLYLETISNPLLEVAELDRLAEIAHTRGVQLVVDNTFSPLIVSPARWGADVVIHSLTKFINGTSDCVAGVVCARREMVASLTDVNDGVAMLLGPTLDPFRAASIQKNLHSLHVRIPQHSQNAHAVAVALREKGYRVHYPGLTENRHYSTLARLANPGFGFGGMLVLDMGTRERANYLMKRMQEERVGYLAVSLGYFKTLFSSPAHSTSSEIPEEERLAMGLNDGLVRFSIGLDHEISRSIDRIQRCLAETEIHHG